MGDRINEIRNLTEAILRACEEEFIDIASDVPHEYWTLENFLVPLEKKWELSFYVSRDMAPLAYLVASQQNGGYHIHHFMVHKAIRGRGVGLLMLAEAQKRAVSHNLGRLTLKVLKTNTRARVFYQKQGFGVWVESIGKDKAYSLLGKEIETGKRVAIHQPNYMPWLGYFHKIQLSDDFVFLDNVQFTKGGYTNRVRIAADGSVRWLTIPLSVHLGDLICQVRVPGREWIRSHLSLLFNSYRRSRHFNSVWPAVKDLYESMDKRDLASANVHFVRGILSRLEIRSRLHLASEFQITKTSDERLIEVVQQIDPQGTYLSGKGGGKYQDTQKFSAAGIGFRMLDFRHPAYDQGRDAFEPGLSVLDAIFHLGFGGTADLLRSCVPA